MDKRYDVIVVGSGCGGAAAAALASYRGLKTLLLEKNKFFGGRAATHDHDGFKLDHCHVIARGAAGPHGDILRMTGCRDLMPSYKYIRSWKMYGHAFGRKIDFSQGMIPGAFMAGMAVPAYMMQHYFSIMDGPWMALLMSKFLTLTEERTHDLDGVDLETYMKKFTDAKIISYMFGALSSLGFGVMPEDTSAGEFIRAIQGVLKATYRIIGYPTTGEGISAVPNSFLRAAARHGAEIVSKIPVDKAVIEGGKVKGVMVKGEMIEADTVISNIGFRETAYNLIGEENLSKEYLDYLKPLKYGFGGITLKYALDEPIVKFDFGGKVPVDFNRNMRDAMEGRLPEGVATMMVCTSNLDPRLAPPGRQTLLAVSPGPPVEVGKVDWEPWVENFKRQIEEDVVPGISGHIIHLDVATPDVIAKESGRIYGDAIGMAQSMDQVGENAPPLFAPIEGIYHVGADVGTRGIGTEMATQSAIDLFAELENRGKIRKKGGFEAVTGTVESEENVLV
ncbi:MAG: NAD(P)/FAD-dependent oxidoreductase [Actinobacteria bacterium]|nr:NAD(P)/FAD-dependent oxidoreductase [Actinomycetota bacterium]